MQQTNARPPAAAGFRPERARATILLIDDDRDLAGVLADVLEDGGYQVQIADSGQAALATLQTMQPDLIVLDLMLPDIDGLILCAHLRAQHETPVVLCSGTSRTRDATLGLRLGADDFIAKPFDLNDFEARIAAVLRRAYPRVVRPTEDESTRLHVGDLVVDGDHPTARIAGQELHLTPTEHRLLRVLAGDPERAFSREELAAQAWDDPGVARGRGIDIQVARLRHKLATIAALGPQIISVRGVGYKLARPSATPPARAH